MFKTNRQHDEANEQAIADGERRYAASFEEEGIYSGERCSDCGEAGMTTGHMGCQYPEDH